MSVPMTTVPTMTKDLHKEIIKRSRLRNIFLKDKPETNWGKKKKKKNSKELLQKAQNFTVNSFDTQVLKE